MMLSISDVDVCVVQRFGCMLFCTATTNLCTVYVAYAVPRCRYPD